MKSDGIIFEPLPTEAITITDPLGDMDSHWSGGNDNPHGECTPPALPTPWAQADSATEATIRAILNSPVSSFWLKDALLRALRRDCVDAANDAEALAAILKARAAYFLNDGNVERNNHEK